MRTNLDKLFVIWLVIHSVNSYRPFREIAPPDDEDFSIGGSGDGPDDREGYIDISKPNLNNVSTPKADFRVNGLASKWPPYNYGYYTTPSTSSSSFYSYSSHSHSQASSTLPSLSWSTVSTSTTSSPLSIPSPNAHWSSYNEYKSISNSYESNYDRNYDRNDNNYDNIYPKVDRDRIDIRVYPISQIIYTTQEVVIRCRDESYRRLPVKWSRSDGRPMSLEATDTSGRLVIPNIKMSDGGEYKCSPLDPTYRQSFNLSSVIVYPIESLHNRQPDYQPFTCHPGTRKCPSSTTCIPEQYFCDGESDCPGSRDEEDCESCKLYQFRCRNGQCIEKTRRCDEKLDCRDGSDEMDCREKETKVPLTLSIVPPFMDVERGSFVQFACASSNPSAKLAWVFEQGELPRTATVIGGTLTIRNAQEFDQGTYICMGSDSYGTKAEAQARLTVRRPQSLVNANVIPSYIEVQEGGNVMLSCNSSAPGSSFVWAFNRGNLPPGAETINNQLRIYQANQRHSGHYRCIVKSPYGTGEAYSMVNINPVMTERRPSMIVSPSHAEAALGSMVRFRCNATDPRPNQIIWQSKRGGLPFGANQSREILTIGPITDIHYGEYICMVTNSYGRNQQTVELHRAGGSASSDVDNQDGQNQPTRTTLGPVIEIQPAAGLNLPLGELARFECRSNEILSDELRWISSSGSLPEGTTVSKGVLVIPSITAAHYGIYACEARNSYGVSRKSVELRPPSLNPNISPPYRPVTGPIEATIEPQQQTIVQGSSGILRCLVTGDLNAAVIWSKVNGNLTDRHRIDGEIMRIENAIINDRGLYVCKVESSPGVTVAQGSAIVEIEPREPPVVDIYPAVTQSIQIGGSALFQCRLVGGIPEPVITWSRADNSPLTSNADIVEGGVIRFIRVTGAEEGIYKCTAENIAGRAEYEVTLRIERTEFSPNRPPYVSPPDPSVNPPDKIVPPDHLQPYRPDISIKINQRNPLVIKEGEPLVLDCFTESSMDTQVIWMSVEKGQYITETATRRSVYQKYDTTAEDSGEYRCVAHNSAGRAEERIQVVIEPISGPHPTSHRNPHQFTPPAPSPYESIRNVTLSVGGSTEFKCHASGPDLVSPIMTWSRESGALPTNAYQRSETLYINKINEDNSGTYVCTGRSPDGHVVVIQRVLLNVQSQLTLALDPVSQVVSAGQRVQINCVAAGNGVEPVQVTWNREGAAMSPNSRIIGGQLVFMSISPTDSGSYICKGISSLGEARAVAHVQVGPSSVPQPHHPYPSDPIRLPTQYETRPPTGKREIVDTRASKTLSCDFARIPNHIIRWEFNNAKILPTNAAVFGNNIILTNIDKNNEGRYICNAHLPGSERPIDRDFIDLIVRDVQSCSPYEFRCYDTTCIERERRCDGRPDCNDGSDEQYCPGEELPPDCDRDDYSRQAYPRQPDTRSRYPTDPRTNYPNYPQPSYPSYPDTRYSPQHPVQVEVKIESNKLLVNVGDDLELRCHADGPDYRYEWFKDIQPVRNENAEINHNKLYIRNVKPENGGVYTCRARNRYGYGTDEHVVMIQRVSPQDENIVLGADLGASVRLECPRTVPGAVYTWARPGQALPKDSEISSDRLILRNVKPNFAGQYECIAKGPQGTAVSFVSLVVRKVIPRFRREMYSHIKFPSIPDPEQSFDIEISVKPEFGEGLIIYSSGPSNPSTNTNGNFVSLSLNRGMLEYRIQSGLADVVKIRSTKPIPLYEWTKIVIQKDGNHVGLFINDLAEVPVKLSGNNTDLILGEPLYIGGIPSTAQINSEAGRVDGFIGCMSVLKIKGRSIVMADEGESVSISSCSTCSTDVCSGHGACHEDSTVTNGFQCICHPGFSGSNCSANVDSCKEGSCGTGRCVNVPEGGFECYCPYGRTGLRCEREVIIRRPAFGGKSYLALPKPTENTASPDEKKPEQQPQELKLVMQIKPNLEKEGLLMYSGQDDSGKKDFAAVTIKNRAIEFAFDTGSGPAFIRSPQFEILDDFVTFEVKTIENQGILSVNGVEYSEKAPGAAKRLQLETPMFIGGVNKQKVKLPRSLNVSHGFDGCIAHVEVNGIAVDWATTVVDSANVDDCGPHEQCTEQTCQNGGICQRDQRDICACLPGFTGYHCEVSTLSASRPETVTLSSETSDKISTTQLIETTNGTLTITESP
ncbi:basement membrane-specific heparan sulfate proteoglycan core protein isoform X1 [Tetranychus urticae]|uniref:basement membrane-specific heparan sulfate proteoglycan core protein isoform X1 n=1 Tax=Tetranychus urticae TaxID=32264 RepID=UPI00077BF5F6|nr:basement membrane-specific heparan sulfate proteoglycan core protein isoform X1 [Tetranychus urticae]XP_025018619.1 basement membrane-specific heparan sulfate proteoglycan core protein isoform X1 [Tetranychus urticae]